MPMETEKPTTGSGGNTGLSAIAIIGVCSVLLMFIGVVLGILDCLFGGGLFRNRILSWLEKRRNSDPRSADAELPVTSEGAAQPLVAPGLTNQIEMDTMSAAAPESEANFLGRSSNQADLNASSEEADVSAGGDQSHQADSGGLSEDCGDRQAVAAENRDMATSIYFDIYLVSTSRQTPQVEKIKDICRRNKWKCRTPFEGGLGMLEMQSIEEAVLTCSHVVLLITEDDCSMKNGKYNMTVEMAFKSAKKGEIGGRVIPIRCCDEDSLPLRLQCLVGSYIEDDDLEARMKITIDKRIRRKREAQCRSMSDAPGQV